MIVRLPQPTDNRPLRVLVSPDVARSAPSNGLITLDFQDAQLAARIVGVARRFPDSEQQGEGFDTIIIQGVLPQDPGVYSFTNGQLRLDRNVRLGSLVTNRYQIETGNGYESDSLRIVLTEQ